MKVPENGIGTVHSFDKVKSWSIGKSYASTVGLAIDKGYINTQKIIFRITSKSGKEPKGKHSNQGHAYVVWLRFDMIEDNLIMARQTTWLHVLYIIPWKTILERSGSTITTRYRSAAINSSCHRNVCRWIRSRASLGTLGMNAEWVEDGMGHHHVMKASCRDQAKFDYLFMKKGCWNGERISLKIGSRSNKSIDKPQSRVWILVVAQWTCSCFGFCYLWAAWRWNFIHLHQAMPFVRWTGVSDGEVIPSEDLLCNGPHPTKPSTLESAVMDLLMTDEARSQRRLERVLMR